MKCQCGCNTEAEWLLTFYDPTIPSNEIDMPACDAYKGYIAGCCAELGLPFEKKRIEK